MCAISIRKELNIFTDVSLFFCCTCKMWSRHKHNIEIQNIIAMWINKNYCHNKSTANASKSPSSRSRRELEPPEQKANDFMTTINKESTQTTLICLNESWWNSENLIKLLTNQKIATNQILSLSLVCQFQNYLI